MTFLFAIPVTNGLSAGDRIVGGIWRQEHMPMTRDSATANGWDLVDGEECRVGYGHRMRLNGRLTPTLLFDSMGHIAGLQGGVNTTTFPLYPESNLKKVEDGGAFMVDPIDASVWSMTIHLTDPETLCEANPPARKEGSIGDRFLIRQGPEEFEVIPLTAEGNTAALAGKSNFHAGGDMGVVIDPKNNGGCAPAHFAYPGAPGMGLHYWGNLSSSSVPCKHAGPIFLLYDHSELVAFGLVYVGTKQRFPSVNGRVPQGGSTPMNKQNATDPPNCLWEAPSQPLFPLFFSENNNLKCLANMNKFNAALDGGDVTAGTIHFHLQNPLKVGCDVLPPTKAVVGECADGTYPWCRDLSWPKFFGPAAGDLMAGQCANNKTKPLCGDGSQPVLAAGGSTTAAGGSTTAAGGSTTAAGGSTTAAGGSTTAAGGSTTAAGGSTTAAGGSTTVAGGSTTAAGNSTTAAGDSTTVAGGSTTDADSGTSFASIVVPSFGALASALFC